MVLESLHRALTKKEKIILLVIMAAIILILGVTRPLWSSKYKDSGTTSSEVQESDNV